MFSRVFFAAILAGLLAGIVLATLQHFRTTPLIVAAERITEGPADKQHTGHTHASPAKDKKAHTHAGPEHKKPAHSHWDDWIPKDGLERTAFSYLSAIVLACGMAFVMVAASLLTGVPITPKNGALWGLVAFAAFSLAPAAGLPPEVPGMPYIDLEARQIWWWATVAATSLGIVIFAKQQNPVLKIAAVILIALPHLIGAPQAGDHETDVPAHLIQVYVANALFILAVVWITIGLALGYIGTAPEAKKAHP